MTDHRRTAYSQGPSHAIRGAVSQYCRGGLAKIGSPPSLTIQKSPFSRNPRERSAVRISSVCKSGSTGIAKNSHAPMTADITHGSPSDIKLINRSVAGRMFFSSKNDFLSISIKPTMNESHLQIATSSSKQPTAFRSHWYLRRAVQFRHKRGKEKGRVATWPPRLARAGGCQTRIVPKLVWMRSPRVVMILPPDAVLEFLKSRTRS